MTSVPPWNRSTQDFSLHSIPPDAAAFPALYTEDAILIFHSAPPIVGPEAIKRFWESRISAGARDHTFEIVETWADGKLAYQLSKAGVQLIRPQERKRSFPVTL